MDEHGVDEVKNIILKRWIVCMGGGDARVSMLNAIDSIVLKIALK